MASLAFRLYEIQLRQVPPSPFHTPLDAFDISLTPLASTFGATGTHWPAHFSNASATYPIVNFSNILPVGGSGDEVAMPIALVVKKWDNRGLELVPVLRLELVVYVLCGSLSATLADRPIGHCIT